MRLEIGKFYAVSDVKSDIDSAENYYFAIYDVKGEVRTSRWSTPNFYQTNLTIKPVSQGNFTIGIKHQAIISLFEEISKIIEEEL